MDTQIRPQEQEANASGRRSYIPSEIEAKWQRVWEDNGENHADDDDPRPKFYNLVMFPYPSGDLHIGHWYNFVGADVYGRYMRQNGYNVMQPLGFDAFGLPAENAAIKRGVQAYKWTMSNIERMRKQLKTMGGIWDWQREVITCLPDYYKWTEWFFLKLYEAGLAYRAKAPVWWCPNDKTVLANEQVLANGTCERCGAVVIKRDLEQWFFRITKYADRLLDYHGVNWPESTRLKQMNWIGRSEGARVNFVAHGPDGQSHVVPVFTTRPDTIFGVTFFLLAPEHPLVAQLTTPDKKVEVEAYVEKARRMSEIERQSTDKDKSGVFIGSYVTNAITGKQVPIWITDYVLMGYGTGAVMGVPAHDQRDFEFARKFDIPIVMVYQPDDHDVDPNTMPEALVHQGHVVNSGQFNGLPDGPETVKQVISWIEQNSWGKAEVSYRIRDWLISRQRYWGAPIPMVYCDKDGIVPVPEEQLPVLLPTEVEFKPSGESPLKDIPEFVNTTCPKCGGPARRETDTMDTFMDSSWYFLRYPNSHDEQAAFDPEMLRRWMPVDQYTGGPEHATMHLLYARFFTMALYDMGLLDFQEPFQRLVHQGMILSEGRKMSKSRGKVVAPDDLVQEHGADAVRAFLMFLGPFERGAEWNANTEQLLVGINRFLGRVWMMGIEAAEFMPNRIDTDQSAETDIRRQQHKTIKRVIADIRNFQFNTALSGLMEFVNEMQRIAGITAGIKSSKAWGESVDTLLILLSPLCPHITEELWHELGHIGSVHAQTMPTFDPALAADEVITIVVQVNGKLRETIQIAAGTSDEEIQAVALGSPKVAAQLNGGKPRKVIYVPSKLVNMVI